MIDDDLRRLKRYRNQLSACTFVIIAVLIGFVAWVSIQIREVRYLVGTAPVQYAQPKNGLDGVDGKDGLSIIGPQGVAGQPGQNDVSLITTTVIEKHVADPPVVIKGDTGEKGEDGTPGRTPEMRMKDGKPVWRYLGDLEWLPLEEVQ